MSNSGLSTASLVGRPDLWAARDVPFVPVLQSARDLAVYVETLLKWNKVFNLSGCHDARSIMAELVQDSFFLAFFLDSLFADKIPDHIFEPGSGAGLPGIPLRLVWPYGQYTLIERRQKRALFLATMLAKLKLPNTSVCCEDARTVLANAKPVQCVISRAFMPFGPMLAFCRPFLASDGIVIFMANAPQPELDQFWKLKASLEYSIPNSKRWLWAITLANNSQ